MKHLVIGLGEVGKAMQKILSCDGMDRETNRDQVDERYDILDICIPFSTEFILEVQAYQKLFDPKYTVIHSTVALGTCDQLDAYHSPITGKHPDLEKSIRTFTKFLGSPAGKESAELAAEYGSYGLDMFYGLTARDSEALKLWQTTQYGHAILLEKEIHEYCEKNGLNFEVVYAAGFRTYNEGYEKMGMPQFKAAVLSHMPGKIGGHCVVPNCHLLDSSIAKKIIEANETF